MCASPVCGKGDSSSGGRHLARRQHLCRSPCQTMDPHEILKVARTIKEKGNNSFKREQLPEAQRDYTEVLATLTEEMTFTGDDQRKEKETLVLTAHLNLALCALRLGDDARVIYHCNIALDMDSDNVKAHFRKARAFENRAEFAKALEGYRHVLTLESDNETVQRQLSECQKKLDNQKEQMSNKMASQKDQDTEDEDVEVLCEDSEKDPQTRYKNCTKNPGHKNFINLNDFKIEDLPPAYQDQELFDYIKNHQSQQTVMLQVWPPRRFRPGCGPGTGRNNSGNPGPGKPVRGAKHGSGWLHTVVLHTENEQPCSCQKCQMSESPEKRWAQIEIYTAGHVVCNDTEAKNTDCYFFFDTEKVDLNSCPKLSGAVIEFRNVHYDTCHLKFISHDDKFSQHLHNIELSHRAALYNIKQKYQSSRLVEPEGRLLELFEQLWQRWTELGTEIGPLTEQVVAILNGDPRLEFVKHRKERKEKLEDDHFAKLLLDKISGGVRYKTMIKMLQRQQEYSCKFARELTKLSVLLPNHERELAEGRKFWQWQWEYWVKIIEREVTTLKHWLDDNAPLPPALEMYNEDHPLTVIVSHPHGCRKKITIGEIIDRTARQDGLLSQFMYTTPTCPGSSGAYIFVLGLKALVDKHPHSAKRKRTSLGQVNGSAFSLSY